MEIAIDFDGTCVTHEFPEIGRDIGAGRVLRELVRNGHKLILFTMRSDRFVPGPTGHEMIRDETGSFLSDAIKWFKDNGIELYAIQTNPSQASWTTSPKCYAQMYIDDAALGAPLVTPDNEGEHPYIDWIQVRSLLVAKKLIK